MASSLVEWVGTTQHGISKSVAYTNISWNTYISSFYIKAWTRNFAQLLTSGVVSTQYANFDLINGTFSESSAWVGAMVSVGNGWYRCSIKYTSATTSTVSVYCMIAPSLSCSHPPYTGDWVSNIYIHAQPTRRCDRTISPNSGRICIKKKCSHIFTFSLSQCRLSKISILLSLGLLFLLVH